MQLSEVYLDLGVDGFAQLIRGISIGKLKTYKIYEGFKVRAHLHKVNTESLRKAAPRFWARLEERDEDFAKDLAQAVLVSHLDMITGVLDFLGVPHENGFFQGPGFQALFHRGLGRACPGTVPRHLCRALAAFLYQSLALGTARCRGAVSPGVPQRGMISVDGVLMTVRNMTTGAGPISDKLLSSKRIRRRGGEGFWV